MTTEELAILVRNLTGTDSMPPLWWADHAFLASLRMIRITGISSSPEELSGRRISPSEARQRGFYSGLSGTGRGFVFIVRGEVFPTESVQLFIALPGLEDPASGWISTMHSVFPGCETEEGPVLTDFVTEIGHDYPFAAALYGNPSMSPSSSNEGGRDAAPDVTRFEDFLSCMTGTEWVYIVAAKPLQRSVVEAEISQFAEVERTLISLFLRKNSLDGDNNPIARQAVDLAKAHTAKYLAGRTEGMWDVNAFLLAKTPHEIERGIHAACAAFSGTSSAPRPFRACPCSAVDEKSLSVEEIHYRLTTSEVAALARLPEREYPGYRMKDRVRFAVAPPESAANGHEESIIYVGTILDEGRNSGLWYVMDPDDLCKHAFVAGVPGQGKTRTCFYLLHQLWEQKKVPWLVLEPSSKSEYRQLLASDAFKGVIQIFTCGHEGIAPIRINPLEVLPGIHVQAQIDTLQTLLNSAFAWVAPMPTVLSKALHRVYRDRGWDLAYGSHPRGCISEVQPTLEDLIVTVDRLCSELGYSAEVTGNIRAGLQTRLSSLTEGGKGLMLNCRISMPMQTLLEKPTVLELSAIGDDDEKAFVLGVILLKLAQFRQSQGLSRTGLRHVTVVEEAHRLLRAVPETVGTDTANSRGKLVEAFCNILAEFRAYGEGIVVVDQIPEKLAPDVIKNTNLKIVHRLVAKGDRELVGGAMNLSEAQQRFLSTLRPGQAVVYSETREYPYLVQVPNHAGYSAYKGAVVKNTQIHDHMSSVCRRIPAHSSALDGRMPDGCGCPGHCANCSSSLQKRVLALLVDHDHSEAYRSAVEGGWHGLWGFGTGIAKKAGFRETDQGQASFCLLMQMVGLSGASDEIARKISTNLGVLRDNAIKT